MEHLPGVFIVSVLTMVIMVPAAPRGLCAAFSRFVAWPSSDVLLAYTGRVVVAVVGVLGHPLP